MTATVRHLRPRGEGIAQPTTTVELFFDLVYVFAVTQLSHQILCGYVPAPSLISLSRWTTSGRLVT